MSFARTSVVLMALVAAGCEEMAPVAVVIPVEDGVKYRADLTGAAEVPPVATAATGAADITVDPDTRNLSWAITHAGLTGAPTAAHFHGPASVGENAPPVIDITSALAAGSTTLTPEQWAELQAGMWYVNIHTAQYPNGEIRGQVLPATE